MKDYIVLTTGGNKQTAKDFAKFWNCQLGKVSVKKFADGEELVKTLVNVEDKDVIIIDSIAKKVNDKAMEILMLLDSVNRCNPRSVTLIVPYLGYSRQDRVNSEFEPISSRVLAKVLETGKYNYLMTLDLHNPAIDSFFTRGIRNIATTELFATYYTSYLKENDIKTSDVVVVSPDHGSNYRADSLAFALRGAKRALCEKSRLEPDKISDIKINGDVKDKFCIILDDIISTGGTIIAVAKQLYKAGAKTVVVGATHGVFVSDAIKKIKAARVKDIVVTNSIEQKLEGVKTLDIVQLLINNI